MTNVDDEELKVLIAAEVARQLKDIRNLPLDELARALGEKLAKPLRQQSGRLSLIEEGH